MTEAFVEHNGIMIPESAVPPPPLLSTMLREVPPLPTSVCTRCGKEFARSLLDPKEFVQCPACRWKRTEAARRESTRAHRRKRSAERDRQKMLDRMNGGFDPRLDDRLAVGFAMMGDEVDAGVARLLAAQGWPGRWEV